MKPTTLLMATALFALGTGVVAADPEKRNTVIRKSQNTNADQAPQDAKVTDTSKEVVAVTDERSGKSKSADADTHKSVDR